MYFEEILKELVANMNNNQWRNRESRSASLVRLGGLLNVYIYFSCLALRDLLSTNVNDSVISKQIQQLWELLIKVLDDVKVS